MLLLRMIMTITREEIKLEREAFKKRVDPKELVREKMDPFQKKISPIPGQLIGAITRHYVTCSINCPVSYTLRENLYAGIITPKTTFSIDESSYRGFLTYVDSPQALEIHTDLEGDFRSTDANTFRYYPFDDFLCLYFMEQPPQVPWDGIELHFNFNPYKIVMPRLELYIGDNETIPILS